MTKIIAFSGCASAGKTTLTENLNRILSIDYSVYTIYEPIREITNALNTDLVDLHSYGVVYEFQKIVLNTQIMLEKIAKKQQPDFIICDRTVFDILIYVKLFLGDNAFNEFNKIVKRYNPSYDLIVYCEPLEFEDDNYRLPRSQKEVELFEQYMKPRADIVLPSSTHHNRLKILLSHEKFKQLTNR